MFIANAIGKTLKESGVDCETIWIADDHDPLRKVPYPLPENYDKYLGMPYSNIPCPDGCCDNFVEHFEKPFLGVLDDFKIEQKDRLFKFTVTRDQVSKSISIYLHG